MNFGSIRFGWKKPEGEREKGPGDKMKARSTIRAPTASGECRWQSQVVVFLQHPNQLHYPLLGIYCWCSLFMKKLKSVSRKFLQNELLKEMKPRVVCNCAGSLPEHLVEWEQDCGDQATFPAIPLGSLGLPSFMCVPRSPEFPCLGNKMKSLHLQSTDPKKLCFIPHT